MSIFGMIAGLVKKAKQRKCFREWERVGGYMVIDGFLSPAWACKKCGAHYVGWSPENEQNGKEET